MRDPRLVAVLSEIIPGVGQLYNGRILAGMLWLISPRDCGSARAAYSVGSDASSQPTPLTPTHATIACGIRRGFEVSSAGDRSPVDLYWDRHRGEPVPVLCYDAYPRLEEERRCLVGGEATPGAAA